MEINLISAGKLDYVLIKDFYLPEELKLIKDELKELHKHVDLFNSGSAHRKGRSLRKGKGLFLEELTNGRQFINSSVIYRLSKKLYSENIYKAIREHGYFFNSFEDLDNDATLISYYENDDYYETHTDRAVASCITFITLDKFSGGTLEFPQFGQVIEPTDNTMVIFPSAVKHKVNLVKSDKEGPCRVSITSFLNYLVN
jgi:Rps23 Pro-64 3,4-dihydroxylase Tpa1-like proline 4-hydroxylase